MTDADVRKRLEDLSKDELIDLMERLKIPHNVRKGGSASKKVIADAMAVGHSSKLGEHFRDSNITDVLSFKKNI